MPSEEELDRIIAELDRPYDGTLPEQALRDAQRYPAATTPRLIGLIESATARIQAGEPVENSAGGAPAWRTRHRMRTGGRSISNFRP